MVVGVGPQCRSGRKTPAGPPCGAAGALQVGNAATIPTPLILIHAEKDNNPGTHTLQSERLFQAIQGTGGTARLVLLPHEAHGYQARESVLHVLAEQLAWVERWAPPNPVIG